MKIINKTAWRTDHLRAFVNRIAAAELDPEQRRRCKVHFVYGRSRAGCSGWAYIKGTTSCIRMPGPKAVKSWTLPEICSGRLKIDLASTLAHELAHNRGAEGERWMRSSVRYGRGEKTNEFYAWAKDLPLEMAAPKVKVKPGPDKKLAGVEALLANWHRKLKLAQTKIKKLNKKRHYYLKKVAAMEASNASVADRIAVGDLEGTGSAGDQDAEPSQAERLHPRGE